MKEFIYMTTKKCSGCKEIKIISVFYYDRKSNKYHSKCTRCDSERKMNWAKNNSDRFKEIKKLSNEKHKKEIAEKSKNYRLENKEKIANRDKIYRENNKETIATRRKIYREKNKEKISEYNRIYRKTHLEQVRRRNREYMKKYYKDNINIIYNYREKNRELIRERNREYMKKYRIENSELIKKRAKLKQNKINERRRERSKNDTIYKLCNVLRSRLHLALKANNKTKHTVDYLGCSVEELKIYLESKFKPGMSWENYGFYGWHIDHIIPLSAFDLTKEKEIKKACHYTNLQPLWAEENFKKGAKTLNE